MQRTWDIRKTGEYRPEQKSTLKSARAAKKGLRALVEFDDKGGEYAWTVLSHVMSYSAALVPEIADDPRSVDLAMQTGYAWKWGPFEMIDMLGADYLADRLAKEGRAVPEFLEKARGRTFFKEEGETAYQLMPNGDYAAIEVADDAWTLADKKRGKEPVKKNASASLWDVGDGVLCLGRPIGRYSANAGGPRNSIGVFDSAGELQNSVGTGGPDGAGFDVPSELPMPPGGGIQPGSTWHFQLWYTDQNPQPTSNLSDGLSVSF